MPNIFHLIVNKNHFNFLILCLVVFLNCNTNNDNGGIDLPVNSLPLLDISSNGIEIPGNPKINAQLSISIENDIHFNGNIAVETRGSSSSKFPKQSFSFETRDNNNPDEDLDVSLLGLPEEEDWILYGPYSDKTLIRNKLAYDLFRDMGNYSSRSVFVELEINKEYQGVYLLLEELKRDDNRIDISKLNPDENSGEDLTGGYILTIDRVDDDPEEYFTSNYLPPSATEGQQIHFLYEEPDAEDITIQQKSYIQNYVHEFENALNSPDFTDPVSGYISYIDVSSFIDFFLINELANNVDAYRLSTYITKDKNGKLKMGPVWDFNFSLGNANYCSSGETNVWAYTFNERCGNHDQQVPFWWAKLLQDPSFVNQLQKRWTKLREDEFSEDVLTEMIDEYTELLTSSGAVDRNFDTWKILGTQQTANNFVGETHQEEISYLKDWISDRLSWLDTAINSL